MACIVTQLSKNDSEYYKRNFPSIVKDVEENIEKHRPRCQEIEQYKMDNNDLSNDDYSMCSVSHISTDTGINNSDEKSMSMDETDISDG